MVDYRLSHTRVRFGVLVLLLAGGSAEAAGPIQDNSFLVEEAYNQDPGVVQTILTYSRLAGAGDWSYTLTQEWPATDLRNQVSIAIPLQGVSGDGGFARGVGDLALNYRYQLVGNGEAAVAVSPRATLLVPTGDSARGLGAGGFGIQVSIPLSIVLSKSFVVHSNVGATHVFSAGEAGGSRANLTSANVGQSVVWLARPTFNILLEATAARNETQGDDGRANRHTDALVSPGVRAALNLSHDLQIVYGLAVPIGVGPSRGQRSLFLYLSAELPVWHPRH